MIIGMGSSPVAWQLRRMGKIPPNLLLYPEFFDDKRALLKGGWRPYMRALIRHRKEIRIALYPDYATAVLPVPRGIEYIVPIHDLSTFDVIDRLTSDGYIAWAGYASDQRYRNYTMEDFMATANGHRTWYLGASTMWELREAMLSNVKGVDVTGYILGKNDVRRDLARATTKIREIALRAASVEGRQVRLMEVSV